METSMKKIAMLLGISAILLTACTSALTTQPSAPGEDLAGETDTATRALEKIRLPMGFIPNVQYAPFYVAQEKGYFTEAGVEVEFDYRTEIDGMALVVAGDISFSIASGEQVLLARAQDLPVVYVLTWWQDYPVAVSAKKTIGLQSPQDMAGKKIGLPGLYGASYIGLRALLQAGGLKEEDVTLDSIGFNQVEALATDQEQAVVVYANNELVQFAAQGIEVDTLRVGDFVALASNGLVTNEATIQNNPDLIRRMNKAILQGIADTLADPDEAFEISKKYVEGLEANAVIQRQVLDPTLEFWRAEQPGVSQPEAWENMQKVLLDMGLLTRPMDLNQAFTNEFVLK
jgi:NitT/TauT family transport system substrate-binding protein